MHNAWIMLYQSSECIGGGCKLWSCAHYPYFECKFLITLEELKILRFLGKNHTPLQPLHMRKTHFQTCSYFTTNFCWGLHISTSGLHLHTSYRNLSITSPIVIISQRLPLVQISIFTKSRRFDRIEGHSPF